MANEKIVLAQLDIDAQALIKSAQKSKEAIDDLTDALEDCKEASGDISDDYKEIAENLGKATKAYNTMLTTLKANTRAMESLTDAQQEFIDGQEEITTSVSQAGSEISGQAKTFNDYKKQAIEGFQSINIFNGGVRALADRSREAGGAGPLLLGALKGITGGIKGMGEAISANPLGLLLQLIAPIIEQLKNFAPLTNAVEQAMAGLAPVIDFVNTPIKLLAQGITWVVEGFTKLIGSIGNAASEAIALKQAEQELTTQMALQEAATEKATQQADALIKKSEDVTLSEQERAQAVTDATAILKKNYDDRKALADKAYGIELSKLQQSKKLSVEEIGILNEGTAAAVQKLMHDKNISQDELDALEKAKIEKIRIAGEETQIKEQQVNAYKSITDELIKKAEDQNLTEKERLDALKDAAATEKKIMNDRKKDANNDYQNAATNAKLRLGITQDDLNGLLKEGDAYAGKARLVAMLSQQEVDALIKAGNEKQRLSREEVEMLKNQETIRQKIEDDATKKRDDEAKAAADDARKKREEAADKAITHQKQMLDLFVAEGDAKAKSLQEELKFEKDKAEKSKAILEAELKAKKISRLEYNTAILQADNTLHKNTAQINTRYSKAQLDTWMQQNKSLFEGVEKLNEEIVTAENNRLAKLQTMQLEQLAQEKGVNVEKIRSNKDKIDTLSLAEQEFYTRILQMDEELKTKQEANTKIVIDTNVAAKQKEDERKEQEKKEKEALDYERDTAKYEQKIALENERHNAEIAKYTQWELDGVLTHEEAEKFKREEEQKTSAIKQQLAIQNMQTQLGSMQNIANALGDAFGQNKELALAQATMNAGQAILSIWSGTITANPLLDTVLKGALTASTAVKTGKQIKEIQSARKPKQPKFAQGGLVTIGGNRHSAGGTLFTGADGTRFEAEQGELIGVMNRNAAAHFMAFNNAFPAGGGSAPNYFAGGGIVSREIASPSLNIDELAAKIALANSTMPAPVVTVQDIVTQSNSYVQVREAANF